MPAATIDLRVADLMTIDPVARCTSEQGYEIDNDRDDVITPATAGLGEEATA